MTVELDRENEIHKGQVIDLKGENEALNEKIAELELKNSDKDSILIASNELLDIEAERTEIEKNRLKFADRFQLITSGQFGVGMTYSNVPNGIYGGVDVGLKFKGGTFFSLGYMAGTSHFVTVRVGQVVKFRKPSIKDLIK
jgi:hypothetical protein